MKTLFKICTILMLIVSPLQAEAAKPQKDKDKIIYRAANMTQEIEVLIGIYSSTSREHKMLLTLKLEDFKSWFEFSGKIDDMPSAAATDAITDFTADDFIIIREKDAEGLVTRETMFTPGLIQLSVYEISFFENLGRAKEFYYDMLEMQMEQASFGDYINHGLDKRQLGVVVEFPISNILPNPIWLIKKPESIVKFMEHIDQEKKGFYEVFYDGKAGMERIESYTKKAKDIFTAYVNIDPDDPMHEKIPYKIYIDDDGTLMLKRTSFKRAIPDKNGYFTFFFDYFTKMAEAQMAEKAQAKLEREQQAAPPPAQ